VPASPARSQHQRAHRTDGCESLLVAHLGHPPPRVEPGEKAGLGLPQVSDAAEIALVEQGVRDAARRVVLTQPTEEALLVELLGHDVRPELCDAAVDARARVGHQLEHRTAELHYLVIVRADHEPCATP
jgi:hypothetical protein